MEEGEQKGENEGRRHLEGGSATQHQRRSTGRKPGDSWREGTSQAVGLQSHQGINRHQSKVQSLPLALLP